jgi:hypothetical protein
LAEIAPGNFRGHYFVARRQKAWFLPAAPMRGAYGASAAISADITALARFQNGAKRHGTA